MRQWSDSCHGWLTGDLVKPWEEVSLIRVGGGERRVWREGWAGEWPEEGEPGEARGEGVIHGASGGEDQSVEQGRGRPRATPGRRKMRSRGRVRAWISGKGRGLTRRRWPWEGRKTGIIALGEGERVDPGEELRPGGGYGKGWTRISEQGTATLVNLSGLSVGITLFTDVAIRLRMSRDNANGKFMTCSANGELGQIHNFS